MARPWVVEMPVVVPSAPNLRDAHWRVRWRRTSLHRQATAVAWRAAAHDRPPPPLPVEVLLVRIAPPRRQIRDSDNLAGAFKAIRDQVAAELGVDDGDVARVAWRYAQERRSGHAVRIEVRAMGGDA